MALPTAYPDPRYNRDPFLDTIEGALKVLEGLGSEVLTTALERERRLKANWVDRRAADEKGDHARRRALDRELDADRESYAAFARLLNANPYALGSALAVLAARREREARGQ